MAGTIATDGERRAIAARIRERGLSECADMAYALGNGCKVGARCEDCRDWMAERLARLVEPQADRDALLTIADRVERLSSDPSRCGSEACAYFGHPDCDCDGCAAYSSDEPCIDLAAKDAASRIRDAIGGGKPDEWIAPGEAGALRFPDGHACDMAEWEDAPIGPGSTLDVGTIYTVDEDSYEAVKWVRSNGGLDRVEGRIMSACHLETAMNTVKRIAGLDDECPIQDLFEQLERRIMPEGVEWPRYESGEAVRFGDQCINLNGNASRVDYFIFMKPGFKINGVRLREYGTLLARPDSWELLEEDCSMNTGVYARERMGIDVNKVPAQESRRIDMMRDLVRRAKALAERG